MNRTGINPGNEALELYKYCSTAGGIIIKGLYAYDGHIRDIDFSTKKKNCDDAFCIVEGLAEKIISAGLPRPIIIAGGSPTFSVHCKREAIECSPGTFIYRTASKEGLIKQLHQANSLLPFVADRFRANWFSISGLLCSKPG